jgi:peptidoglycan/xylan/chitin deacetylase (PgdA/CDA1 family)
LYLAVTSGVLVIGGVLVLFYYMAYSILQEYRRDRVPALLYHRLISREKTTFAQLTNHDRSYETYDSVFNDQMAYLYREGFKTISLDQFLSYQKGLIHLPPQSIMLTFDDGFASNYYYAFPVLKKYGMTATIFVTPDTESENFKRYRSTDSPLNQEQMREMSEQGISIQSHGMTHRYLTDLEPDVVRWELTESKKVLEQILGKPVQYLAIPSGAYNRTIRKIAHEAGYKAVFCMLKGSNNKKSDLYALRRLVIGRDLNMEDFRRILQPAAASYLRLTSSLQNALLFLLGPAGLDALRDRLYGIGLGPMLTRGQVRYFVPCLGAAALLFLVLLAWIFRSHL